MKQIQAMWQILLWPLAFAAALGIAAAIHAVHGWLEDHGWPADAATLLLVLFLVGLVIALD